jgi:hypothetical protein
MSLVWSSRGSLIRIWAVERAWICFRQEQELVLFSRTSIPAPGLTQSSGMFARGRNGRGVKLPVYLQLVPRLRLSGAIRPLTCMPSWRLQGQLTLTYGLTHGDFWLRWYFNCPLEHQRKIRREWNWMEGISLCVNEGNVLRWNIHIINTEIGRSLV